MVRRIGKRPSKDLLYGVSFRGGREQKEIRQARQLVANSTPVSPVNVKSIPRFVQWVDWFSYHYDHAAFDYAAYIQQGDQGPRCVFGLPADTKVQAIAKGKIGKVFQFKNRIGYASTIYLDFDIEGTGFSCTYGHVMPKVSEGQEVEAGQPIATLYKDPEDFDTGRLVHLHFELTRPYIGSSSLHLNPAEVYPNLSGSRATPQGNPNFQILGKHHDAPVVVANFPQVAVNGYVSR